jgi:hypothetical protein
MIGSSPSKATKECNAPAAFPFVQGRTHLALSEANKAYVGADAFVRPASEASVRDLRLPPVPLTSPFIFAVLLSTVKEFTETAVPLF